MAPLKPEDGSITIDNPTKQERTLDFIQKNHSNLKITPLINNFNSPRMQWETAKVAKMLSDGSARRHAISQF